VLPRPPTAILSATGTLLIPYIASYYFSSFKSRSYPDHTRTSSSLTIRDIGWNPPGNRIACALTDKLVRVWNPDKPEIRMSTELKGHTAAVSALAWDPTHSDKLASCSIDGTVRFWDYRIKQMLAIVNTGGEGIAIAWHPDGKTVAVATRVGSRWVQYYGMGVLMLGVVGDETPLHYGSYAPAFRHECVADPGALADILALGRYAVDVDGDGAGTTVRIPDLVTGPLGRCTRFGCTVP